MKLHLFWLTGLAGMLALNGCAPEAYVSDEFRTNPPKIVVVLPPENTTSNTEV